MIQMMGAPFDKNRYGRYMRHVIWRDDRKYYGETIERAYHKDDFKPCALYRCVIDGYLLVAINLQGIKDLIKDCLSFKEEYA